VLKVPDRMCLTLGQKDDRIEVEVEAAVVRVDGREAQDMLMNR